MSWLCNNVRQLQPDSNLELFYQVTVATNSYSKVNEDLDGDSSLTNHCPRTCGVYMRANLWFKEQT